MRAIRKTKLNADYIKDSIPTIDFFRYELPEAKLKSHGWNDGGLCPFHDDRKPGSFRINLISGAYKCFACGTSGGDIIDFVRALHGLSFVEALKKLADEWGC